MSCRRGREWISNGRTYHQTLLIAYDSVIEVEI